MYDCAVVSIYYYYYYCYILSDMTCHLQLCDKYYFKLCIFSDYTDSVLLYIQKKIYIHSHCGRQQCSICVLYLFMNLNIYFFLYKYCIYSNLHLFIFLNFFIFQVQIDEIISSCGLVTDNRIKELCVIFFYYHHHLVAMFVC